MIQQPITVQNKLGLHARASAKLMKEASRYASRIFLTKTDGETVNTKSIMGLMMLSAKQGTVLTLEIEGDDEDEALIGITQLFDDKFGEGE